jgi:putative spermidine/putrescine transport system substrate-binding protein
MKKTGLSRRAFVKGAAGLASVAILTGGKGRAQAAGQLRVMDSGAQWQTAAKLAVYEPFEKETGIKVVYAAGMTGSATQLKAMVQTGRAEWDVSQLGFPALLRAGKEGLLEPLDYGVIKTEGFMPGTTHEFALGFDTLAYLMAYDHTKFPDPQKAPKSWVDFWDLKGFPGRRSMGSRAMGQCELALLADGVPPDKLYPIDFDRAFRKLDQVKRDMLWWTAWAQIAQFAVDRQVDVIAGFNARLQGAIENGAPFTFVWNQAILGIEGWGVVKGTPFKAEAMRFLAFTTRPEVQATFSKHMAFGPVNREAFKFLSPERAKILPTNPDSVRTGVWRSEQWWGDNEALAEAKWAEWRLK